MKTKAREFDWDIDEDLEELGTLFPPNTIIGTHGYPEVRVDRETNKKKLMQVIKTLIVVEDGKAVVQEKTI